MAGYDDLAIKDGDDECGQWVWKLLRAKDEITAFVASKMGKQAGEHDSYLKGSFNLGYVVRFNDGEPKVLIRFPKPGHTPTDIREEKVRNEVQFLEFLREKTTIPVPQVVTWGMIEDSPQHLGPFIIMNYVEGTCLASLLEQPPEDEGDSCILAPDIDDTKLDYVYEQIADYLLQLSRLEFSTIGALSKNETSKEWIADGRPLTFDMNILMNGISNYPTDGFPTAPFTSTKALLHNFADENLVQLRTQRNIAKSKEDVKKSLIARHQFKKLISRYCLDDNGPFKPYCDDLRPANMLADPETLRITAVLDFEFSNILPSQFAHDPPWWLLLLRPETLLEQFTMQEFVNLYVPRMEQFLRAMERVETKENREGRVRSDPPLSARMRESWETGRFWFDYGIRKGFDVDEIYQAAFQKDGDDVLDEEMEKEAQQLMELKMEQLEAYTKERENRSAPPGS